MSREGAAPALSRAELAELFPFCFEVDREMRLTGLGPRWSSFVPEIRVGDDFHAHFEVDRPLGGRDFDSIWSRIGDIFILRVLAKENLMLRGQMVVEGRRERLLFVGGPWIVRIEDLGLHGIGFEDFPPHDPRGDLLILLQSRDATLGDLKLLATRLRETARRLDERNRQLEEQLVVREQLEAQLRQSQKVEAVGRLAGGVAHDFNNILMAISGYASLASTRLPEGDQVRNWVEQIRAAADRATGLTQQLLAFSRQKVIQPAAIDAMAEVKAIERILRPLIGENICFSVVAAEGLGSVWMDPTSLHQIIMNLVINARDAMPRGGQLTVRVFETPRESAQQREAATSSAQPPSQSADAQSWLTIEVVDNGTGMDEKTKANIFDPFFTTKDVGKGSGLGLSTVYGLVQQGGGQIEVESELGKGAKFLVRLPKFVASAARPEAQRTPQLAANQRVLLVEDEDLVRRLVEQVLVGGGYKVTAVGDPRAALALAESSPPFDLLVSDVVMSGSTGLEMARMIEKSTPRIPTIFMSGYTDDPALRAGTILPHQRYIAKPFTPEVLLNLARVLLQRRA